MKQYEYKVEWANMNDHEYLTRYLNKMGKDGWQLVSEDEGQYIFMREKK